MKIFGFDIRRAESTPTNTTQKDTAFTKDFGTANFFFPGNINNHTGALVTEWTVLTIPTAKACIDNISDDFAKVPFYILDNDTNEIVKDHPLTKIFANPNQYQNVFDFKHTIMSEKLIHNESLVYIKRKQKSGELIALIPLHRSEWSVDISTGFPIYNISSNKVVKGGGCIRVRPIDVLHNKGLSTNGGLFSLPNFSMGQDMFGLAIAAQEFAAYAFKNGINPSVFLQHPGLVSPEAGNRLVKSFVERTAGVGNTNKPVLLEEGMTVEAAQKTTADETGLINIRRQQDEAIARFYRMPLSKLSMGDAKTAANFEQDAINYVQDCLSSHTERFIAELENKLFLENDYGKYRIEFDFGVLLKTDKKTQAEINKSDILASIRTRNEVRKTLDLPPVEGGDDFLTPLNMSGEMPDHTPKDPLSQHDPMGGTNSQNA